MAYQWTTNHETPITVDGVCGPATIKALQYGLGVGTTGVFGSVTDKAFQTWLGVTADGRFGPATIKALQKKVGATQDGVWGPATTLDLQAALNAGFVGTAPWYHGTTSTGTTSTGSGSTTPPPSTGGGRQAIPESSVQYVRGQSYSSLSAVVSAAAAAAGVPTSWEADMLNIIIPDESSGDPNSVNDYDLNANGADVADGYPQNCSRGLAQCIPPTFANWHAAGTSDNIYDPVANVAASFLYIVGTYGTMANVPGVRSVLNGGSYQGY